MKSNEHEQAKPNVAGLTSQVQQAEMKLILAGKWPALKPLPVFKYGTDEYRAEIYFDGTRGEWVCRKTSLPSNKVQELRGGLVEMTMTLPHGQEAEVFTEDIAAAEQQEQELENEDNRRLQAIHEWKENYGNGTLYSGLQNYLSESQQDEIYDSIRMSLTARQLQFNPKNVAFVFDALWNAGGRLTTLIEIARRNRAEQETGTQNARCRLRRFILRLTTAFRCAPSLLPLRTSGAIPMAALSSTHPFAMRKRRGVTRRCSRLKALMQNTPSIESKPHRQRRSRAPRPKHLRLRQVRFWVQALYFLSMISRKKCTTTLQPLILDRKFEQTESSGRRIV
jgi:hypothetical protein